MLFRPSSRPGRRRRGAVSLFLVLTLPALLLAVVLALHAAEVTDARERLQHTADATALSAVEVLVDDDVLLRDPERMRQLFEQARREARAYHGANPVCGSAPELDLNRENRPGGDVVLGFVDSARECRLEPLRPGKASDPYLHLVNGVRVTVARTRERGTALSFTRGLFVRNGVTDLVVRATAMLDRDVIGFRPVFDKPIPLVPITILSDPTGRAKGSWEWQVSPEHAVDRWAFDREERRFEVGRNGHPEVRVRLGAGDPTRGKKERGKEEREQRPNACVIQVGATDLDELAEQVRSGIAPQHLKGEEFAGEFLLGPDNKRVVGGS